VAEDNSLKIATANLIISDPDNTPAQMTVSVGSGSDYSVTENNTVVPTLNYNGTLTVPVTVTDGIATSNVFDLTVMVTPVNDAPVVTNIPDQRVEKGKSFAVIDLDLYVNDIETADNLIVWTFMENTNLNVSIVDRKATVAVKDNAWTGSDTIVFWATDNDASIPLSAADSVIFTVVRITGLEDNAAIKALVYPNPTSGFITILFEGPKEREIHLEILSLQGKVVETRTERISDDRIDLNLGNLSAGTYFIVMKIDGFSRMLTITKE